MKQLELVDIDKLFQSFEVGCTMHTMD